MQDRLTEEVLKTRVLIQVHDELDLSVPVDELDRVEKLLRETMENVAELRVPLLVDVSHGENWAQAH